MSKKIEDEVQDLVALRDELSARRKAFKQFEADQKVMIEHIEVRLLEKAREIGVESFRTKFGTAFKTEKKFVRVGNWDSVLAFIIKTGNWSMLEKRLGKLATMEVLADIAGDGVAPEDIGVEFITEEVMQVRRS